jgi:hypothetical protein
VGCSWRGEGLFRPEPDSPVTLRRCEAFSRVSERSNRRVASVDGSLGERLASLLAPASSLRTAVRAVGRCRSPVSIATLRPMWKRGVLPRADAFVDRRGYAADLVGQRGAHVGGDIDVPRST